MPPILPLCPFPFVTMGFSGLWRGKGEGGRKEGMMVVNIGCEWGGHSSM